MEQVARISCSAVKTLKSTEQSSLESPFPARMFVPESSRAGIAPVSNSLLLVFPFSTVPRGEMYHPRKGRIGREDFFMLSFHDFRLQPATRAVLAEMEITEPTPIQAEAIPALIAGHDLVGHSTPLLHPLDHFQWLCRKNQTEKELGTMVLLAPFRPPILATSLSFLQRIVICVWLELISYATLPMVKR